MPIFRDVHGRTYDIPKSRLAQFLVESADARITGTEIASPTESECGSHAMGYVWGEESAAAPTEFERGRHTMGYIWGEDLGYKWGDELGYVWGDSHRSAIADSSAEADRLQDATPVV